jgi:hypothetical protein
MFGGPGQALVRLSARLTALRPVSPEGSRH